MGKAKPLSMAQMIQTNLLSEQQKYDLVYLLKDAKVEILSRFMGEVILTATRQGFAFRELITALAIYANSHPELQKAERHLDLAAEAIKEINLNQVSNVTKETTCDYSI
jgi:hypothetical protein